MILKELKIQTWIHEKTNCYVIFDEESKEIMVIDPAGDVDEIENLIKEVFKGKLKYIYLTHCHVDHIAGVQELKKRCGGKVLIHNIDAVGLENPDINLSKYVGAPEIRIKADSRVNDGDLLHLGSLEFKVLYTPGHTKGSSSLYCKEKACLFSGDTIFAGTWGRSDLPTSSRADLIDSILNKILVLPNNIMIYPGHGKATELDDERPIYLQFKVNK